MVSIYFVWYKDQTTRAQNKNHQSRTIDRGANMFMFIMERSLERCRLGLVGIFFLIIQKIYFNNKLHNKLSSNFAQSRLSNAIDCRYFQT